MAQVLVVEDDPDQLAIRCLLVENVGFQALGADNGRQAIALAQALQPICALVDLHLPTKELGLKLVRELKATVPGIQILLISGHSWNGTQPLPAELGVYAIIQKGSSVKLMLQTLREAAGEGGVS